MGLFTRHGQCSRLHLVGFLSLPIFKLNYILLEIKDNLAKEDHTGRL